MVFALSRMLKAAPAGWSRATGMRLRHCSVRFGAYEEGHQQVQAQALQSVAVTLEHDIVIGHRSIAKPKCGLPTARVP
jgi:hypothetical protein